MSNIDMMAKSRCDLDLLQLRSSFIATLKGDGVGINAANHPLANDDGLCTNGSDFGEFYDEHEDTPDHLLTQSTFNPDERSLDPYVSFVRR